MPIHEIDPIEDKPTPKPRPTPVDRTRRTFSISAFLMLVCWGALWFWAHHEWGFEGFGFQITVMAVLFTASTIWLGWQIRQARLQGRDDAGDVSAASHPDED